GANMLGPGKFGYTAIKKGSPDRVQELLRIIDFFAAPFGSEEYVMVRYGARDVDYKLDANGVPVQTDQGKVDLTVSWMYIGAPPCAGDGGRPRATQRSGSTRDGLACPGLRQGPR